jgi:hypothetical protein
MKPFFQGPGRESGDPPRPSGLDPSRAEPGAGMPDLEFADRPTPDLEAAPSPMPDLKFSSPARPDLEMTGPAIPNLEPANPRMPDLEMGSMETMPSLAPSPTAGAGFMLEFGDFVPHIPSHLLRNQPEDARIPFPLDIAEVTRRVVSGKTTLLLSEIYRLVPVVFVSEIPAPEDVPILYPWQKIARLITAESGEESSPEKKLLLELVKATAAARIARPEPGAPRPAIPPPPATPPGQPPKAPAAPAASPEAAGTARFEQELEIRLAAMRSSHARELSRVHSEREAIVARVTADTTRDREALRKDYEDRLAKVTSARDEAHARIARLEAAGAEAPETAPDAAERQLAEATPFLEKQRLQFEARLAELQEEHAAVLAGKEDLLEWNVRTIADLDDQVKTYRARIKVVLGERDALAREKESLAAQAGPSEASVK